MKSITFRPTSSALDALAALMEGGDNRSQAICAALIACAAMRVRPVLKADAKLDKIVHRPGAVERVEAEKPRLPGVPVEEIPVDEVLVTEEPEPRLYREKKGPVFKTQVADPDKLLAAQRRMAQNAKGRK